jgi:hypothetical protein
VFVFVIRGCLSSPACLALAGVVFGLGKKRLGLIEEGFVAAAAADPSPWAAAQAVVTDSQNLSVRPGAPLATWTQLANAAATSGTYTLAPGTSGTFNMQGYGTLLLLRKAST